MDCNHENHAGRSGFNVVTEHEVTICGRGPRQCKILRSNLDVGALQWYVHVAAERRDHP
jgi:hypothetical protein